MLRKLLLGSVSSFHLLSPLALPTSADAHDYRHHHRPLHVYRVYYRDPCRPGWIFAGNVHGHREAVRFADPFRCRGFEISIR
jgi:hypothetical protein